MHISNIAVFINHTTVAPWQFMPRHAAIIEKAIIGSHVVICHDETAFLEALQTADAALAWTFRQEWFNKAARLRVLSTPAAGKDYFHVVPPASVTMLNGHFHGEIIAETVVGMILSMIRGILPNATNFHDNPWARQELTPMMRPLRNATVTILGFGHIGRWIGQLVKPFGTHIIGICRHADAPRPVYFEDSDIIATTDSLAALLPQTDHLVLALPGTTGTTHIIGREQLALLPDYATVTNIGRGNAIDEAALIERLSAHKLLGAVLDVFAHEPLPANDPLRSCPNLWTLPHASAIADNYLDLYAAEIAQDLLSL